MPVSNTDLQTAQQELQAAQAALQQARDEHARLTALGPEYYDQIQAQAIKVNAARDRVIQAQQRYTSVQSQYNRENPVQRPPTQAQQIATQQALSVQQQQAKNLREIGLPITDAQRDARERAMAPKPARTDSPVQIQQANTAASRAAEDVRHNQQTEQIAIINAQRQALVEAGTLSNNLRTQISREAEQQTDTSLRGIESVRGAATTLIQEGTARRKDAVDLQQSRMTFINNMLTTAMPRVAELMMKTKKGSPVAANFFKAFLAMANEAYVRAGLNNDPPPIDPNSPEMRAMRQIAGYRLPDQLPRMPTSDEITWRAAKSMAASGFPPPGWNGPIGVAALDVPDPPNAENANGNGINADAAAEQSPEGKSIADAYRTALQSILSKPKDQWTPQEQRVVQAAQDEYKQKIRELARKQQAERRQRQQASPEIQESDALKNDIRETLVSGDPNTRLNTIALIDSALQAKEAGRPLTPAQTAILANIDAEDVALVRQALTPQVRAVLQKGPQGATEQDYAEVNGLLDNVSRGLSTRATPSSSPAPTVPERRPPMLPDQNAETTVRVNTAVPGYQGQPPKQPEVNDGVPRLDATTYTPQQTGGLGRPPDADFTTEPPVLNQQTVMPNTWRPVEQPEAEEPPDLTGMLGIPQQQPIAQIEPPQQDIPDFSSMFESPEERRRREEERYRSNPYVGVQF